MNLRLLCGPILVALTVVACGGGGGSAPPASGVVATVTPTPNAAPTPTPTAGAAGLPGLPLSLSVNNLPGVFYGEIVAQFSHVSPRGMVMLPNGDLLVGTGGGTANFAQSGAIYIVPNAEAAVPAGPTVFATLTDGSCAASAGTNTNGITFAPATGGGTIFVGMECSVWKIPYVTGDHVASSPPSLFVNVRTGATAGSGIDSDDHHTTSVLASGSTLYISVGSSCNACIETDPTRGTVQKTSISSAALTPVATRIRNGLALAANPATGTVWVGGAGQDCEVGTTCFFAQDNAYQLNGHPYEWLDPMTTHAAPADYRWPWCEENNVVVAAPDGTPATPPPGTTCTAMIVSPVRGPAYGTIMGATFYAPPAGAAYAFPSSYDGGLFFTLHGSWHENASGVPVSVPQVVFVPMTGDAPVYPMDWSSGSPYSNWARNGGGNPEPFMNGFQSSSGIRGGRPAGIVVGPAGSVFISDDDAGEIYRIRPGTAPAAVHRAIAPTATGSRR